ncbi:polysaccharide deacetylase family protein [Streptococcus salivarius]|uniref:polysaccharide deacetylase family protein n=1 Tax=Streptococcus salivarius TaxID=1304 RepID=UPI00019FC183|nr:polysaccharide deacetylase family protein [Streptococcus salivarius]EEK09307.1 polysaccharide deacetylase [Streptococcus salivarius SK126]QKH71000.1 polysaccharide deacetylase family protein [Streptococcus salivarius]
MTSQKKKSTNANRKKLNLLLLLLNLVLLGLLAVFMLKRPNQSKSTQQKDQTSQSKTTAKWKTYDDPVQIPILMYHAVHVMDPPEASNANLIVDPDLFEAQIKALSKAGYYFLTPEEAYKAFTENVLPAKKVVWLTFDDGNEDFYTIAYPILKKYKAKATNNVITGFVKKGNAGNLTVKQMKEMMAHGMSFQSHTVNHPDLSATDKATQKVELTDSIDFLENKLNTKVNTIAYPSGRYNQTTLDLAKKTYKLGLTTNEGLASAKDGLLSLNRVRILPTTTAKGLLSEIATDNE